MFQLTRPLCSIDLETTGINHVNDRIVQVGIVKLNLDGTQKEWQSLVNPLVPIPKEASDVHHITDEMVANAPTFQQLGPGLFKAFEDVDFCGYNLKAFDLPFLASEFKRINLDFDISKYSVVDAFRLFVLKTPRNLTAAVKHYLGEELPDAHDALADARASLRIAMAQLQMYEDVPKSPALIHAMLFNPKGNNIDSDGKFYFENGEAVMNFGKYRNTQLRLIPKDYLNWVLRNNFSEEIKAICRDAIEGKYPQPRK